MRSFGRQVPVIVVFTKFDELVTAMEHDMDSSRAGNRKPEEITALAKKDADAAFSKICVRPLQRVRGKAPYARVSSAFTSSRLFFDSSLIFLPYYLQSRTITVQRYPP
jgi:hypothetical protein